MPPNPSEALQHLWDGAVGAVVGAVVGGLVGGLVTIIFSYRERRQSLLLDAYSEWLEAFRLASAAVEKYVRLVSGFADTWEKQQKEITDLRLERQRLLALATPQMTVTQGLQVVEEKQRALSPDVEKDGLLRQRWDDEARDAEVRLGIALNRIQLIERSPDFQGEAQAISLAAIRPEWSTPVVVKARGKAFIEALNAVEEKANGRFPLFMNKVIKAHGFRGLCVPKSKTTLIP